SLPVVPAVPGVPSAEDLSALPAAVLAVRLAEAYRLIGELTAQAGRLSARVEQLERQARKDSSTSSRPPSSDSPYKKKGSDRSLRERGKRRPGKQPGDPGSTMSLVDDPDDTVEWPPAECRGCGADLAGVPVAAQRRHQVTDIAPAPAPKVTEYVAQAKECAGCGAVTAGELPAHVRARASYGPETCAQAANLVSGRAARLVEAGGFTGRVRGLLKAAPAVHADETPARAAGGTRYVHLACTRYLTCMHTGDRSAKAIDAGGVLPGYAGRHRPRRLRRLRPPDQRPARLVRGSPAQGSQGPARLRARTAAMGGPDGEPAHRGPRRRRGRPRSRPARPGHHRPGRPGHPLPGTGHRRPDREPLPAHRHREGRPPPRPPVPLLRGHDPAVCHPPRPGHLLQQRSRADNPAR